MSTMVVIVIAINAKNRPLYLKIVKFSYINVIINTLMQLFAVPLAA